MKHFEITTHGRDQFVDITMQVQQAVQAMGMDEDVVTVFTPHTTCGITINEKADPDVPADMLRHLDSAVPWRQPFYEHAEGNSAAHVKSSLMGTSVNVIVTCGRLQLGVWQAVFLCEFDGPRTRRVWVK